MGLKGKLVTSVEVKCEGHSIHDMYHTNTYHICNISPLVNHVEIHEGEIFKVGVVISWKYIEDGKEKLLKEVIEAIDHHDKSITWKVIGGDVLELYNSFTIITSNEHEWATTTLIYEKKNEDTPEPLALLGAFIELTKHVEDHLLMK
ncbi:kirola-like [Solanum verrucosum]|uniref:kirola-like n=1 Tax=Solanum verrucosum TaxID=315347 RepID=UPI0020D01E47|nr:kirola-like [Solanum verrucosum]